MDKGSKTQQERLERELGAPTTPNATVAPTSKEEEAREQANGTCARWWTTPTTCCWPRSWT